MYYVGRTRLETDTSLISGTDHRKGLEFHLKFLLLRRVVSHLTNSSYKISVPGFAYVNTIKCWAFRHCLRGEQIPGAKSTSRITFVLRRLICGVHSMKRSMSPFWSLEIEVVPKIWQICSPDGSFYVTCNISVKCT